MTGAPAEPAVSDLVHRLVTATSGRSCATGLSGVVAFGIGSKLATMEFVEGRVVGVSAKDPQVSISLTRKQFDAWSSGGLSLSVAYMQGDLKPEGSTGALLAALEVLDDPQVKASF